MAAMAAMAAVGTIAAVETIAAMDSIATIVAKKCLEEDPGCPGML
jgi:hypothetical protein